MSSWIDTPSETIGENNSIKDLTRVYTIHVTAKKTLASNRTELQYLISLLFPEQKFV
jgi:hypothetical protein